MKLHGIAIRDGEDYHFMPCESKDVYCKEDGTPILKPKG
jgi:hypothetical protein